MGKYDLENFPNDGMYEHVEMELRGCIESVEALGAACANFDMHHRDMGKKELSVLLDLLRSKTHEAWEHLLWCKNRIIHMGEEWPLEPYWETVWIPYESRYREVKTLRPRVKKNNRILRRSRDGRGRMKNVGFRMEASIVEKIDSITTNTRAEWLAQACLEKLERDGEEI